MNAFISGMRFIGDLDNEFYHDEHQRDVWNEASAIGFQMCFWMSFIAMAVLPWLAGSTGAWVAVGLFLATAAISVATLSYSKSRRVDMQARNKPFQPRGIMCATLYLIAATGVFLQLSWVTPQPGESNIPNIVGAIVGGIVGAGAAVYLIFRARRRRQWLDKTNEDL